jgi:hypothetical protein
MVTNAMEQRRAWYVGECGLQLSACSQGGLFEKGTFEEILEGNEGVSQ